MKDAVGLRKSAKALEESFFEKKNQELLRKLREQGARERKREALRDALKLDDEEVLDGMVELDLEPETIVALGLVPLIEVAWADGAIQSKEREAVLRAAEERGVAKDTISHQLLDNWLHEQPAPQLLEVWRHYARALVESLGGHKGQLLVQRMIGNARAVAEAAGGFLGLGAISAVEKAVLEDLEATFR
jgi:hypothetical protein